MDELRREASRELAKALAYVQCGKMADAKAAADRLRQMLSDAGL